MKKFNSKQVLFVAGLLVTACIFNSCENKEDDGANTPMTIRKVFLENAQSSVPDREVTFARLGQIIRLEGSGFAGVSKAYVNGKSCYFNPVFVTDNSMMLQISADAPTIEAPDAVRNTIRLEKSTANFLVYNFEIRASAPTVTRISHTMPQAGDVITIHGSGLQGVESIAFPGNVIVTAGIVSDDEDGKWCTVVVPEGVSGDGGSLLVIGANGGAYSPACFNYRKGLFHNFDDVQNYAWGSGIDNTALTEVIPAGKKPQSQGGYQVFNATGSLAANSDQRFWLNSANLTTALSAVPASTPAADCGIQMDIYVEGEWNSGIIRFVMADGWGASRYCMIYQPVYIGGTYDKAAFENPGTWFTVTLPFGLSADFEGKTLGDVIAQMSSATYKQAGPWFENTGITDVFDPVPATEKVYFDNIRVVPLNTPIYSDFPDKD
ncbi:MAG: glycan-binding surface protein [Dysgonamonadaceae bacterium]|jgi:hypothetical protein|nr:glycan-binding surface protein [Dysgonamonadaceae bacterium]